ncbi:MAG: hypothetical protein A2583_10610 [Bdellovibrionales bacterium RIFOXYD1_FULL_53_11]|nr:MAG: hypothetical protein A2583_10610 [Bdellovibrionales bacterium RIFOXYD1_FULL_53_11]
MMLKSSKKVLFAAVLAVSFPSLSIADESGQTGQDREVWKVERVTELQGQKIRRVWKALVEKTGSVSKFYYSFNGNDPKKIEGQPWQFEYLKSAITRLSMKEAESPADSACTQYIEFSSGAGKSRLCEDDVTVNTKVLSVMGELGRIKNR